jgi:predicted DNA-binding protein (MmcQ/YjbR family)
MNIEEFRNYCLAKKGTSDGFPFDKTTLVIKVMNKMFALTDIDDEFSINIKCEPENAVELREKYSAVKPGYHMNKALWNTILIDGSIPDKLLYKWIDDSYNLIVDKLTKKEKEILNNL